MISDKDLSKIAARVASSPGKVRTAGKIEFVKDSGPLRRDIRVQNFEWSQDSLRNLAKILWAAQRSHSYAVAAYRLFSKMPSSQFSPDGLLGGRGYIQGIKDMRSGLAQAVETLSAFTDTVHDEINADHWKPAEESDSEVAEIVQDAAEVKANPEQFIENEYDGEGDFNDPTTYEESPESAEEEEEEVVANPAAEDLNPQFEEEEAEEDDSWEPTQYQTASKKPGSKLPTDDTDQKQGKSEGEILQNTTTPEHGNYASAIGRLLRSHEARFASGPVVEHIGPGASGTESGAYGDAWASDDPAGEGLSAGTNESTPIYEDWCADGVTGYDDATTGDNTVLKVSARIAAPESYSWLPGSNNDRNLNYYERGLSDADVEWMRQHAAPAVPPGILAPEEKKVDVRNLWEVDLV